MKNRILIIFLLISTFLYSQKIKTVVYYKNGDSIVGYSKGINYNSIKFSIEKKGKYKKKDINKIERVLIYHKEGIEEYHHLYVKKRKKEEEFYARLVKKGNINYYIYSNNFSFNYISNNKINLGNGTVLNQTTQNNSSNNVNIIYLKKKNDKRSVYISDVYYSIFGAKIFRKNAGVFFKDCSNLIAKIKSRKFKKSDIIEIIEFYNKNCE